MKQNYFSVNSLFIIFSLTFEVKVITKTSRLYFVYESNTFVNTQQITYLNKVSAYL